MTESRVADLVVLLLERDELADCEPTPTSAIECPGMGRLEQLAIDPVAMTLPEREHLESCRRCRLRLAACGDAIPAVVARPSRRVALHAAAALAIALAGLAIWQQLSREEGVREVAQSPGSPSAPGVIPGQGCDVSICVDTAAAVETDGGRRVQVELIAEEDCVAMAMVGAWDESCQCLEWKPHRWTDEAEEGGLHSRLGGGVPRALELEMDESADAEHAVLVLTARDAGSLPADAEAARRIVECLGEGAESIGTIQTCVPDQVCIAQQSFVVR